MSRGYVILWHGTSKSRADSIVRTGFYANSFFARSPGISWGYASSKQKQDDPGVLVLCAVDLTSYKKSEYHKKRNGLIYHFKPPVPKNAVAGIFRIDEHTRAELNKEAEWLRIKISRHHLKRFEIRRKQPQAVITRNCSEEAIAYWINSYLSTRNNRRIKAAHPGVTQIRTWVEKNYDNGRISPISDWEMLTQLKRNVPDLFRKTAQRR